MSRTRRPGRIEGGSFPRVSGDEPAGTAVKAFVGEFSPRERG